MFRRSFLILFLALSCFSCKESPVNVDLNNPEAYQFSPKVTHKGGIVTITAKADLKLIQGVKIDSLNVKIIQNSDNQLKILVPDINNGLYNIYIVTIDTIISLKEKLEINNDLIKKDVPFISYCNPTILTKNGTFTIYGLNLDFLTSPSVLLKNLQKNLFFSGEIKTISKDSILVKLPNNIVPNISYNIDYLNYKMSISLTDTIFVYDDIAIKSISKSIASPGDFLEIKGVNFNYFNINGVYLDNNLLSIDSQNDSIIRFKVPDFPSQKYSISISSKFGKISTNLEFYLNHSYRVNDFEKEIYQQGDTINLTGYGFTENYIYYYKINNQIYYDFKIIDNNNMQIVVPIINPGEYKVTFQTKNFEYELNKKLNIILRVNNLAESILLNSNTISMKFENIDFTVNIRDNHYDSVFGSSTNDTTYIESSNTLDFIDLLKINPKRNSLTTISDESGPPLFGYNSLYTINNNKINISLNNVKLVGYTENTTSFWVHKLTLENTNYSITNNSLTIEYSGEDVKNVLKNLNIEYQSNSHSYKTSSEYVRTYSDIVKTYPNSKFTMVIYKK